jgi:hypothetical protein
MSAIKGQLDEFRRELLEEKNDLLVKNFQLSMENITLRLGLSTLYKRFSGDQEVVAAMKVLFGELVELDYKTP